MIPPAVAASLTWHQQQSSAQAAAIPVNAAITRWIHGAVAAANRAKCTYRGKERYAIAPQKPGRDIHIQFPGLESDLEGAKRRPFDCRPLLDGAKHDPMRNVGIWTSIDEEFLTGRMTADQVRVIAAIIARMAYCHDHVLHGKPLPLFTTIWSD